MDEILPGLHVWSARRETIGATVYSAYVEPARALIDPMEPAGGMAAFDGLPRPERIVLTNRLHRRHSERFAAAFGCSVAVSARGLDAFADAPYPVRGYEPGEEAAPGVIAHDVGVLCPDESALLIDAGPGALAVADGVIRGADGALAYVPDWLLGDDPAAVRRGLAAAYLRLCDALSFDALLLAHGAPAARGGRDELRAFAAAHAEG